jgi:hypothetical protein
LARLYGCIGDKEAGIFEKKKQKLLRGCRGPAGDSHAEGFGSFFQKRTTSFLCLNPTQ